MDTSNPVTNESVSPRKTLTEGKRQHRSAELKRQIVEETLAPGASVARVARAHGVNANQVFAWRRQYCQRLVEAGKGRMPGLLAVRVAETPAAANDGSARQTPSGTMAIELPKGRLQVTGCVDPETLRVVLGVLLG